MDLFLKKMFMGGTVMIGIFVTMAYYQSKIKETLQTVKRSFNHCSLYLGYSGFLLHFCFLVVKGTLTYRLFDLFEEKGSFFRIQNC